MSGWSLLASLEHYWYSCRCRACLSLYPVEGEEVVGGEVRRDERPVGWGEVFGGEVEGALGLLFEHPGGRVFGREVRGALSVSSVRPGGEEGCSEERFVVL